MAEPDLYESHGLLHRQSHESAYNTLDGMPESQSAEPKSEQRNPLFPKGQHTASARRTGSLARYLPFTRWILEYRREWFLGDFMGALTVSSLYVPLSISFALMGHAHPISGLYSFVVNPILYALLGTCPLMVVGPEAPGSLLVGAVVTASHLSSGDGDNDIISAQIAGTVTAFTGVILFVAGLSRFGFVNSILSPPFMRGIIGALGLNVVIQNTLTGLGLGALAWDNPNAARGSPARTLLFILTNLSQTHRLTAIISVTSFVIVMVIR
jgi:MFS superfamily sulfate permease-like transporter